MKVSFLIPFLVVIYWICIIYADNSSENSSSKELYSDKYDDHDANCVLSNDKLRQEYYNCYIGKGPCRTKYMQFLGGIVCEAMETNCEKCTDVQKKNIKKYKDWYTANRRGEWDALVNYCKEKCKKKKGSKEDD